MTMKQTICPDFKGRGSDSAYKKVCKKCMGTGKQKRKEKDEPVDMWQVSYQHTYLVSSFMNDAPKSHACLRMGDWCLQNFIESPLDIITYLKHKL